MEQRLRRRTRIMLSEMTGLAWVESNEAAEARQAKRVGRVRRRCSGAMIIKVTGHPCIRRRTLLVLDGLEPLQNPPGAQEGRLRDVPSGPIAGACCFQYRPVRDYHADVGR
jgi:hypothetical protein